MPKEPHRKPSRRTILDTWFPTIIRYAGVVLIFYAALIDKGKNPALIPAATGMFFFKTIYGSGGRD